MPEPRPDRPSKLAVPITVAIVVIGVVAVIALAGHGDKVAPDAPAASSTNSVSVSSIGQSVAQIKTMPVQLQALDDKVSATGLVTYPADTSVKIAPRVTGRVEDVYPQVGDHVTAGQAIAVIDSPDAAADWSTETQNESNLRLAQDALGRAESQYKLGTPEVTSAQATYDQAVSNAAFDKSALDKIREQSRIGGFAQQPLETAKNAAATDQSNLVQSQADLDMSQKAYDRMVKLVNIGVNSQADLENASDALAHARANVDANQKVLDLANEALAREQKAYTTNLYSDQALITSESTYRQAKLQEDGADRALEIAKAAILTDLQTAQNGYANAVAAEQGSQAALALIGNPGRDGRVTVTSPISGVVVERDANPGQMVDQSQMTPWQLMVVSNSDKVWVNADVYEKDVRAIHAGEPVSISVDAYPAHNFTGSVVRIAPTVNPTTRAVTVRAEIPNTSGLLKDGMFAEMNITTGQSDLAPVIPIDAVQHDADTDFVYVKKGDTYVRQNVQIGETKGGSCLVTSGLKPGDNVVTQGALLLGGQVESD